MRGRSLHLQLVAPGLENWAIGFDGRDDLRWTKRTITASLVKTSGDYIFPTSRNSLPTIASSGAQFGKSERLVACHLPSHIPSREDWLPPKQFIEQAPDPINIIRSGGRFASEQLRTQIVKPRNSGLISSCSPQRILNDPADPKIRN